MRFRTTTACLAAVLALSVLTAALGGAEPTPPNEDKLLSNQLSELKQTVDLLRIRVADLEGELAIRRDAQNSHRVVAPFEVVDKAGKVILRVRGDRHGMEMVNAAGQTVLWASALDNGGLFKTRSSTSFPEVVMGSVGNLGAFTIRDGEDQDRASLKLSNGKPVLELYNDNHTEIVSLGQGTTGGGRMALGQASGTSAVLAGATPGAKCGRVDTYPLAGSGRSMVGAAPTFILGAGC